MSINLKIWFEIIWMYREYLKPSIAKDPYTGANCIHYCCILGHRELLQKILETEPSLATSQDEDGNTPLHYLCLNSVSKFSEMKEMWKCLTKKGAKDTARNGQGKTWIQVIKERIKLSNPYDDLAKWNSLLLKD